MSKCKLCNKDIWRPLGHSFAKVGQMCQNCIYFLAHNSDAKMRELKSKQRDKRLEELGIYE